MFAHAVQALQARDISGWMEIYAPDSIHEFPFAPTGAVRRLEGRDDAAQPHRSLVHRDLGQMTHVAMFAGSTQGTK